MKSKSLLVLIVLAEDGTPVLGGWQHLAWAWQQQSSLWIIFALCSMCCAEWMHGVCKVCGLFLKVIGVQMGHFSVKWIPNILSYRA